MDLGISPISGKRRSLPDVGAFLRQLGRGARAAITPKTGYEDWLNAPVLPRKPGDMGPKQDIYLQPGVGYFSRNTGEFLGGGVRRSTQPEPSVAPSNVTPVVVPAGTVQPGVIVKGLTPSGTVDYSQGDEYKAQLAQYRNLIQQQKQAEAEDLGMKIFMQQYAKSPIAQAGGAVGAFNPLLAATFPETKGYTGTFAAEEEPLYGRDLGASAQGALGPTMESLNPLASQAAQQEATATQADMATTAGLSAGDRTRAFLRAVRQGTI